VNSRRIWNRGYEVCISLQLTVTVMFSAMLVLATPPPPPHRPPTPQQLRLDLDPRLHASKARPRGPIGPGVTPHGWAGNRFGQQSPSTLLVLSAAHTRAFAYNPYKPQGIVKRRALRKAACPKSAPPAERW
jgi:hypothetical protein